ncbi:hypothetical protein KI387_023050, partial [Taxus chinensis]
IGTLSDCQGSAVSGPSLWRMSTVSWGSRSSGGDSHWRRQGLEHRLHSGQATWGMQPSLR